MMANVAHIQYRNVKTAKILKKQRSVLPGSTGMDISYYFNSKHVESFYKEYIHTPERYNFTLMFSAYFIFFILQDSMNFSLG